MRRTTMAQFKCDARRLAALMDIHTDVNIAPNSGMNGWDIFYSVRRKGKNVTQKLMGFAGTITQCHAHTLAAIYALETKRQLETENPLHNWWKLDTGDTDVTDTDREHIAEQIKEGFTEGQIVH